MRPGRNFVAAQVVNILQVQVVDEAHMHHNYAFTERLGDRDVIVVRKGAPSADVGMRGIIAGSMGTRHGDCTRPGESRGRSRIWECTARLGSCDESYGSGGEA
jgi:hypothetical protein